MPSSSVAVVFGTRPEAIKLAPVISALREAGVEVHTLSTGQHDELLKGTPLESATSLGLPAGGDVHTYVHSLVEPVGEWLETQDVGGVIVQGDTSSAYAGALAAEECDLPVFHVEAGVRSHAREPWPEEEFRREISAIAAWHYTPTRHCTENLRDEGYGDRVVETGNPVVDVVPSGRKRVETVLVTLHRRELDSSIAQVLKELTTAIDNHTHAFNFVWPRHPRWGWRMPKRNYICEPMPHYYFAELLAAAHAVITDSGGVQEEACVLGTPCAVLRNVTDRPESVATGAARVFPPRHVANLGRAVDWACGPHDEITARGIFGLPGASERIATHIKGVLSGTV